MVISASLLAAHRAEVGDGRAYGSYRTPVRQRSARGSPMLNVNDLCGTSDPPHSKPSTSIMDIVYA